MALQKKFIDIVAGSFALGAASAGVVYATLAHSLGTAPDVVLPIVTSVGAAATSGPGNVFAVGGNASIATIGLTSPTAGAVFFGPAIGFNALIWKLWEPLR